DAVAADDPVRTGNVSSKDFYKGRRSPMSPSKVRPQYLSTTYMVADLCLICPDRDARDCDPTCNELRPTKSWTRASPPRMFGTMHESDNTEEQTHENRNHRRGPHRRHAGG